MHNAWWRHQMETFSALLAICAGNSLVLGEFPSQRPVTRSFDVFFDLRLNKRLSKQSWGWWFETPSCSLWRHSNGFVFFYLLWLYHQFSFHSHDILSKFFGLAEMIAQRQWSSPEEYGWYFILIYADNKEPGCMGIQANHHCIVDFPRKGPVTQQ